MRLDSNQKAFFALLQAGLWEKEAHLAKYNDLDYWAIYRLAEEQSVVGLVAAGLDHVSDVKVPQEILLRFVGGAIQLEQRNTLMNRFISSLIEELRRNDVYTLLLKGQGVAQCYERPLWRASGDVDLFLSSENYKRASYYLRQIASRVDEEDQKILHLAMSIDSWEVEIHGTLRCGLWKSMDSGLDEIQHTIFCDGKVRSWMNDNTQVFLPNSNEDIVFVFAHILQHFFFEGVGMRQICDWCRLLWTYKDSINHQLLVSRIRKMGVMTEWKAFAALAVDYLGMSAEAMPFYSPEDRWSSKADKVMRFVLETGNFGHNRDYSYQSKYPYLVYKAISAWKHIEDFGRYYVIFPLDAIKVTWNRIILGIFVAIKRKKHE